MTHLTAAVLLALLFVAVSVAEAVQQQEINQGRDLSCLPNCKTTSVTGSTYLGCYSYSASCFLGSVTLSSASVTLELCESFARSIGTATITNWAVTPGSTNFTCDAFSSMPSCTVSLGSNCASLCPGNSGEYCGGQTGAIYSGIYSLDSTPSPTASPSMAPNTKAPSKSPTMPTTSAPVASAAPVTSASPTTKAPSASSGNTPVLAHALFAAVISQVIRLVVMAA